MNRPALAALALVVAVQAQAQERDAGGGTALRQPAATFADGPPLTVPRRGFSLPVVEYTEPGGVRVQRRGIIASKELAPGASIGVGLLEFVPKSQGFSSEPDGVKRKRRAAVGLTVKF